MPLLPYLPTSAAVKIRLPAEVLHSISTNIPIVLQCSEPPENTIQVDSVECYDWLNEILSMLEYSWSKSSYCMII